MVLSVEIPDADGDTAYGYVTAEPYLIKEDGTNYIQYTLWTADGEKVVREKVSSMLSRRATLSLTMWATVQL